MYVGICEGIHIKCDYYSREKQLINRRFKVRQLFKGDNYSREETIN